jgi:DNA-binding NarL/FixJ family response regulator
VGLAPKCKHTQVLGIVALNREGLAKDVHNQFVWLGARQQCRKQKFRRKKPEETAVMDLNRMKVTPRDQQVLDLLVQGCSNKEIAGQLSISPRTVKQHLRTLFLRAGIREGRKRVRLATAAFEKAEVKS